MSKCWNYANLVGWQEQASFLLSWVDKFRGNLETRGTQEWFQRWHISEIENLKEFENLLSWWNDKGVVPNEFFVLRSWQTDISIKDVTNLMCPHIHTDTMYQDIDSKLNGTTPKYSVNFPLRNCEGTSTHFFRILDTSKNNRIQYYNLGEYGIDPAGCEEIDRYYLTEPIIMNVQTPHCIHNPMPTIREVACFRFPNDYKLDSWM